MPDQAEATGVGQQGHVHVTLACTTPLTSASLLGHAAPYPVVNSDLDDGQVIMYAQFTSLLPASSVNFASLSGPKTRNSRSAHVQLA